MGEEREKVNESLVTLAL